MENILKIASRQAARKPDISQRTVSDMKPALKSHETAENDGVYYTVYRNLEIIGGKFRHDITIIPQKIIGGEYAKTFGHYHENSNPELYEVLDGRAYFLIQRYENDPSKIKEAYIIEANEGEKAIMPPGFGHLAVNIGKQDLVLANWISIAGGYNYNLMKKFHGGCYYIIDTGADMVLEKNSDYSYVPELKKLKPKDIPALGIKNGKNYPIADLKNAPQKLEWLSNWDKYADFLTIRNLYEVI